MIDIDNNECEVVSKMKIKVQKLLKYNQIIVYIV